MNEFLLINGNFLEVESGEFVKDKTIHIKDGRILSIQDEMQDESLPTINFNRHYILPGFIDAHVHVNAISANLNNLRFTPPSYVLPQAIHLMEKMLMRGFTTVRDAAGADWGIAQAVEEGYITSPRIIFGGQALSPSGGHGDSRDKSEHSEYNPAGTNLSIVCNGVPEVRKAARDLIRTGAKHIKIMASGGVASPTDRIDSLQFSTDEIKAIVEEAQSANIYVLAHAYTARAINRALRLGVRSIEHGNLLNDESIDLFLQNDAFLVSTLVTYYALKEEGLELGLPKDSYDKIAEVLENGKKSIEMAYKAGVNLVYGSDLLGEMQVRQLEQFQLLADILSPIDTIRTATTTAAKLLNMENDIGKIEKGYFADLIAYSSNPLSNTDILLNKNEELVFVMKQGKTYYNNL